MTVRYNSSYVTKYTLIHRVRTKLILLWCFESVSSSFVISSMWAIAIPRTNSPFFATSNKWCIWCANTTRSNSNDTGGDTVAIITIATNFKRIKMKRTKFNCWISMTNTMTGKRKISINNTKLQWQYLCKFDSYTTFYVFIKLSFYLLRVASIAQNREHTNVKQYNETINTYNRVNYYMYITINTSHEQHCSFHVHICSNYNRLVRVTSSTNWNTFLRI